MQWTEPCHHLLRGLDRETAVSGFCLPVQTMGRARWAGVMSDGFGSDVVGFEGWCSPGSSCEPWAGAFSRE